MDAKHFFDSEQYFAGLCDGNKYAQSHNFKFCTCSGIESLQGPLDKFRATSAFLCLDDTNDGAMYRGKSGGWFKQRTFTVFILHRYRFNDEQDRAKQLAICRELFRQLASRMIVDADDLKNELIYLQTESILCRELGQYFLNGCTGLYFMINVDEPVDVTYSAEQWTK